MSRRVFVNFENLFRAGYLCSFGQCRISIYSAAIIISCLKFFLLSPYWNWKCNISRSKTRITYHITCVSRATTLHVLISIELACELARDLSRDISCHRPGVVCAWAVRVVARDLVGT